jgi:hypothetical protein
VEIPRATQSGWLMQMYESIKIIKPVLRQAVLESGIVFTDDTPVALQDHQNNPGKFKKARLWVYVRGGTGPPLTVYDFSMDRGKKRPLEFLEDMKARTTPSEPLRKAIDYSLNQKEALYRYLENGYLKPDNNTAENAMRPVALGRKNWLFVGSERGGARRLRPCKKFLASNQSKYSYHTLLMFFESKMIKEFIKHEQSGCPGVMDRIFYHVTIAGFDHLRAKHQQFQTRNSDFVVGDTGKCLDLSTTTICRQLKITPEVIRRHNNLKEDIVVFELARWNRIQSFLFGFTDEVFSRLGAWSN